ncbi:MAG TPA: glycosyltransferase family 1 protein [Rubrobacteraceae bacterium]|nr:glycosyltransferase family 1 protein [Rubrobacteraceae bacterium]
MRIAFVTETFLPATDGVVSRLRHTLEELAVLGDEAFVVAPKYPEGGPDRCAGAPIYRVPGVPFPPYPQIRLSLAHPGVGRALRRFRPDVIHTVNPFVLGPGGIYYAWRLDVPLVASYHTHVATYARYYGLRFLAGAGRWYTRQLHNRAVINLCTSRATMERLLDEGIERVHLWPQGVDARRFSPDKASQVWRERLCGGHPEEKLLLYVGRLGREKGIERLRAVTREVPGTRLAIVGDGPARRDLERAFAGTSTVFAGLLWGEDLAAAYASADVFLFPSTTETLGMAMIEALASGLPVIAARSGATDEVVTDGESGILYEKDSTSALVGAVRRLLSDEGLRQALSRGARSAAERRDWAHSTRTLRGYYLRALEKG